MSQELLPGFVILNQYDTYYLSHRKTPQVLLDNQLRVHSCQYVNLSTCKTFHWELISSLQILPSTFLLLKAPLSHSSLLLCPHPTSGKSYQFFCHSKLPFLSHSYGRTLSLKACGSGLLIGFSASSLSFLAAHFHDVIPWLTSLEQYPQE